MFLVCSLGGKRLVFLTYRYGLRPTRLQYAALEEILEGQRLLYNAALEERIGALAQVRNIDHARRSEQIVDDGEERRPARLWVSSGKPVALDSVQAR